MQLALLPEAVLSAAGEVATHKEAAAVAKVALVLLLRVVPVVAVPKE
jgi:hypothetical protein